MVSLNQTFNLLEFCFTGSISPKVGDDYLHQLAGCDFNFEQPTDSVVWGIVCLHQLKSRNILILCFLDRWRNKSRNLIELFKPCIVWMLSQMWACVNLSLFLVQIGGNKCKPIHSLPCLRRDHCLVSTNMLLTRGSL